MSDAISTPSVDYSHALERIAPAHSIPSPSPTKVRRARRQRDEEPVQARCPRPARGARRPRKRVSIPRRHVVAPGLITSALNGDAGAQRRLYEKLEPVIRQTVRRELRRRGQVRWRSTQTDVDDLVQDMFIHLLSSDAKILREWNPVRGMAFIRLVVERRVITVLRSRRLNPAKLLPVEDDVMALLQGQDPDTEHRVGNSLKVEVMAKRLRERVSERGWRMYQALFIEDLETGEIARRHDMKPNAIFQWRRRLRVQCRQILAELEACG